MIAIEVSDLQKIVDALKEAYGHHHLRDSVNAGLHLTREVRLSPLTSMLASAYERGKTILEEANKVARGNDD